MRKIIFAMLTLLLMSASPIMTDNNIGLHYPIFWEFGICTEADVVDVVYGGYNELHADGVWVNIETVQSNNPPTWQDYAYNIQTYRINASTMHGFMDGTATSGKVTQGYVDAWARDLALNADVTAYGASYFVYSDSGYPCYGLNYSGLVNLVGNLSSNGMYYDLSCHGAFSKDAYGTFGTTNTGKTYIGYSDEVLVTTGCNDLKEFLAVVCCKNFSDTLIPAVALEGYNKTSFEAGFWGNQDNSLNL